MMISLLKRFFSLFSISAPLAVDLGLLVFPLCCFTAAPETPASPASNSLSPAAADEGGAQYFVDQNHPAANDANPGARDKPFKTIAKAAEVAGAGDTVRIAPGVYREAILLRKSGTKERPIVFEATRPGEAIVSGADVLTGWRKDSGDKPIYWVTWSCDFFANKAKPGIEARTHGGKQDPAEVKCAEEVIWEGRPLRQALAYDKLAPGRFYVDWDKDRLHVWLPGGQDPNACEVQGAARAQLFAPFDWAKSKQSREYPTANFITVRGLVFRYAADFPQAAMVITSHGWRMEDCVFEWANAQGLQVKGGDCVIARCVAQDNGQEGMGGSGRNILVRDCVIRRSNWKGFNVSWSAGGGKWANTDGLRMENVRSYENTGHGIWLDVQNFNYLITGCVCYGNRGLKADSQGSGIFAEISPGPGRIVGNTCYSNTGAGIKLGESANAVVENNILVDNGAGIELRDMTTRRDERHLRDVTIRGNTFKAWRGAAIEATLGEWSARAAAEKRYSIDGNVYDPPSGKPFIKWGGQEIATLADARKILGIEAKGEIKPIAFAEKLLPSKTMGVVPPETVASALAGAKAGDEALVPIYGRTPIRKDGNEWACQGYDLNNHYAHLRMTDEAIKDEIASRIPEWPMDTPVHVKARIVAIDPGGVDAIASGIR